MLKLAMVAGLLMVSLAPPLYASNVSNTLSSGPCKNYINQASGVQVPGCTSSQPDVAAKGGLASQITNTILYAAGFISFIFVLIGGFRYITATGDSGRIQSAKDTLLYAVIGLVISLIALPIAGFVIKKAGG